MFGGEPQPNEPQLHQHRTQSSGHAVWAETRTPSRSWRCFVKIFLVVQIFSANHTLLSRGSELLPESRRSLERLPRCWRGRTSPPLTLTYCNTHKERDEEGFYRGQSLCLYNGLNLEQSTQPGAPPDTTRERLVDTLDRRQLFASPAVFPFVTSPRLCPVRCPLELQANLREDLSEVLQSLRRESLQY